MQVVQRKDLSVPGGVAFTLSSVITYDSCEKYDLLEDATVSHPTDGAHNSIIKAAEQAKFQSLEKVTSGLLRLVYAFPYALSRCFRMTIAATTAYWSSRLTSLLSSLSASSSPFCFFSKSAFSFRLMFDLGHSTLLTCATPQWDLPVQASGCLAG